MSYNPDIQRCRSIRMKGYDYLQEGMYFVTICCQEKLWQRNYLEHIIRNDKSYQTIAEYIINNPAKWNDDRYFHK